MLGLLAGAAMVFLPLVYWATRPSADRPPRPWQVLYREGWEQAGGPSLADRLFLVGWLLVAVVAGLRDAL